LIPYRGLCCVSDARCHHCRRGAGWATAAYFLEEQSPFSFDPVIERRVKSIQYTLDGRTVSVPLRDRMMGIVMRDRLDAHILAHARAEVRQGTAVRAVTETPDGIIVTRREPIATSRTLLVGDAAGLVDPLTGEGIRLAIQSGRLSAQALVAEHPDRYPGMIHRQIGMCHTFGLGLAQFFYHHPRGCLST